MRLVAYARMACSVCVVATSLGSASLSAQTPEGRLERDGAEIFYRDIGSGPPLLLLHGFFRTGELWDPFVDELSASNRLIVPDMRGHGRSTNPSQVFLHRDSAADILALLDHLEISEVQAIGHSSGAMTLLHAATVEPERFRSLVLLGGTAYFPEECRALQRAFALEALPPEVVAGMRLWHPGGDEQIQRLVADFNAMSDSYDDMNFTAPFLGTISAETLIVHGDRDEYFPVEIALEMYRAIPHSYLWVPPNANHHLLFWGSTFPGAESFLAVLQGFLAGEWSGSR